MKRKPKIPAARNPFVALALNRKAGSHRKTNKAVRRAEKVKSTWDLNLSGKVPGFYPGLDGSSPSGPTKELL